MRISKGNSKHYSVAILLMFAVTLAFLSSISFMHIAIAAPGWLAGWDYRKSHVVGSAVGAGTNYQIEILVYYGIGGDSGQTVYCNGKCKTDFGDLRFTGSDGTTLLDYWIEEEVDGDHALFWVEIADDLSIGDVTVYVYFGNAIVATTSNGDNTFVFFDHFSGDNLDAAKWTVRQGNVAVSGDELILNGTSDLLARGLVDGLTSFGINKALHSKSRLSVTSTNLHHFCSMKTSGKFDDRASDVWTTGSTNQLGLETVEGNNSVTKVVIVDDLTNSHMYEAQWKSGQTKFYVDGSEVGVISSYVPSTDMVVYFYESRVEGTFCFVDYCFVSNWVDPEPVNGAWGEQEQGRKPMLTIGPSVVSCRKLDEIFALRVNLSEPYYTEGFEFEMRFNTTLLDYVGGTWNAWETGTISVNETDGIILGSAVGTPVTGNLTILSITFNASCMHIWKNEATMPGWKNDQTGSIFIQQATLNYSGSLDLSYERGGLNQIEVGPDAIYTWSPIKGDADLDGRVDIFDLRAVANYCGVKEGDPLWPLASKYDLTNGATKAIDILDLIVVSTNYGYQYP